MNPGDDDAAFMDALDHGAPAPLSLYRRAYAAAGVPWPGEAEVRHRHPITDEPDRSVAELARQQGVQPIRSADDLIQPGAFSSEEELNEFLADLETTRPDGNLTTLLRTVIDTHHDIKWLNHSLRTLLDHHGIRIDDTSKPPTDRSENDNA